MNIYCMHCGESFSITQEQLGKRGKCPHCRASVILPKSNLQYGPRERQLSRPGRWTEISYSGIITIILHGLVLFLLAMIPWGKLSMGTGEEGDQIAIGRLARQRLVDNSADQLQSMELENPTESMADAAFGNEQLSSIGLNALADAEMEFNIGGMSGGAGRSFEIQQENQSAVLSGADEAFGNMISRLKQDGLDIVIVFDSSGSMQGEIDQVKREIRKIGETLLQLVPKTRIGICTYRDVGDEYVVKGLPLTDNIGQIVTYLETIRAHGGGDKPEAVDEGLRWAIGNNRFRRNARKVILLFGDAPPHASRNVACQKLASDFRNQQRGVVSTVTCRSDRLLKEFVAIAQIGDGESFLTTHEREIMKQLVVLVFGSKHRAKVLEAFDLMDGRMP